MWRVAAGVGAGGEPLTRRRSTRYVSLSICLPIYLSEPNSLSVYLSIYQSIFTCIPGSDYIQCRHQRLREEPGMAASINSSWASGAAEPTG